MKKKLIGIIFLFLSIMVYSQTWTVFGDADMDCEYTIITKEQFDRIVKANEITAQGVTVEYFDESYMRSERVIKGSRPRLNGYYYLTQRLIPKTEDGRIASSLIGTMVLYGNINTGAIMITFVPIALLPGVISLKYNWNEYANKYNQLIKLVNGE